MIQETWNPSAQILDIIGGHQELKVRTDEVGGGTLTMWKEDWMKLNRKPVQLNKDSQIMKCTLANNRILWLGSIYISKGTKKNILEVFVGIKDIVPEGEWCRLLIAGDWNIDILNIQDKTTQTLTTVIKQMGLELHHTGPTRQLRCIDFAVTGREIKIVRKSTQPSLSDHQLLIFEVQIPRSVCIAKTRIPSRTAAENITLSSLKNSTNTLEFLINIDKRMRSRNYNILKTVKQRKVENKLLTQILHIQDEDSDLRSLINDHYQELISKNEDKRFSTETQDIKDAFKFLKKMFKYHEFERRDGSIVNRILLPDGSIESQQDEVNKALIDVMRKAQLLETEPKYDKPTPFPRLRPLTFQEALEVVNTISTGKAIAFDGISDIMFQGNPSAKLKAARIVKDAWSEDWEAVIDNFLHFVYRLMALNKVHPNTPEATQFRPITITSPWIKTLEARLYPKLKAYMTDTLHRGQTGFVPGMGIMVNQMRLIERISEKAQKGRVTYGLFIDFSNAYNTILHTKLYERLHGVLTEDEIQLIKALYSRQRIRLGKEEFTPNVGVAQGSIISPALFNIYSEDLYNALEEKAYINFQDLLGYADDLLIICSSKHQLRQVINTIKEWSIVNNLGLNAKKSGV